MNSGACKRTLNTGLVGFLNPTTVGFLNLTRSKGGIQTLQALPHPYGHSGFKLYLNIQLNKVRFWYYSITKQHNTVPSAGHWIFNSAAEAWLLLVFAMFAIKTKFFEVKKKNSHTICRVGNWLIGFLSESLVKKKNKRMSNSLKKTNDSLIRSFLVSDLSNSLMVTHFW